MINIKKILIVNGPNLNLLGVREPDVYGHDTLESINNEISEKAEELNVNVDFFQSNHEGGIIDKLHFAMGVYDGIVINPGAYSHYSIAIRDAISSISIPTVEVHLSDINSREEFRRVSVTAPVCIKQICGFGKSGYVMGLKTLLEVL